MSRLTDGVPPRILAMLAVLLLLLITAPALLGATEQAQLRRVIGAPAGGEDFLPGVLGIAEHQCDELAGRIVGRAGAGGRRRLLRA